MAGTNKVSNQSLDWSAMTQDLFDTGLSAGKQILSNKLQLQINASKRDTMEKAAQTDTAIAGAKAKTYLMVGAGLVMAIIAFKMLKKFRG